MKGVTHLIFGFLVGTIFIKYFGSSSPLIFMILVLLGSLLPDIDHPNSKLGKFVKPIGWVVEHRGFFHSLLFLFLITLVSISFFKQPYALPLGALSHLISDSFTKQGIKVFFPFKFRLNGFIVTGSIVENLFQIICVITIFFLLF